MISQELIIIGQKAKASALKLGLLSTAIKNAALEEIAKEILASVKEILDANSLDLEIAEKKETGKAMIDRLSLDGKRIEAMAAAVRELIALKDPIGEVLSETTRPNGLNIKKIRVPLGVIGIIYEARPNVTVDAATLCLKAGNAVILRGGSDAINSNLTLVKVMKRALDRAGMPEGCLQLIESTDRKIAEEMMTMREYIDVLIPRGGKSLIQSVVTNSKIPTLETGEGVCHLYIEKHADQKMAAQIAINAKCSRPSVCNAIEKMLVDETIAKEFLPRVALLFNMRKVELRGDEKTCKILPQAKPATVEDWSSEYLDLTLAIKVVSGIDEAIAHINKYGTKHSDAIVTKDADAAKKFLAEVDAAAVYHNASTRFTDGGEFGFGAEIGISTQKLHARGPMGLPELTTYKYIIEGTGQVRN